MLKVLRFKTTSEKETEEAGASLFKSLKEGDVILLHGELGAGKTCFVRGLMSAVQTGGGDLVKSPTYTILNIYNAPLTVYHYDFYRVDDEKDIRELGLDEYWGKGICIVEWPKNFCGSLPGRKIDVMIGLGVGSDREIEIRF
jgi:tRNA threonylcarbamoyladenosine biosynthesis protein TsaE